MYDRGSVTFLLQNLGDKREPRFCYKSVHNPQAVADRVVCSVQMGSINLC